jgi:AraC-like DNA-binding protein
VGLITSIDRGEANRLSDRGCDVEFALNNTRLVLIASQTLLRESFAHLLHTRLPDASVECYERVEDMPADPADLVLISADVNAGRDVAAAFAETFRVASETCGRPPIGALVQGYHPAFLRSLAGLGVVGIVDHAASGAIALAAVRLMIMGGYCFPPDTADKLPIAPTSAIAVARHAAVEARFLTDDPKLLQALEPFCDISAKERRTAIDTLRAAVEKEVEKLLPRGKAQKKTVARALGMSARTLSRRLAVAETTYEEIVDQLRRSLALRHLKDPSMTLSQISWLLGYECSSSFSHAFRRWTGSSPSVARKGKPLPAPLRPDSWSDRLAGASGPRMRKIGTRGQAVARDVTYLVSRKAKHHLKGRGIETGNRRSGAAGAPQFARSTPVAPH